MVGRIVLLPPLSLADTFLAILAAGGALAAERYGRRPLWLLSATGMLCAFIVITALSAVFTRQRITAAGTAVVPFLFIFFGFYDIAFTPLSISYIVEILPFSLRAKGLSANLTVRVTERCRLKRG